MANATTRRRCAALLAVAAVALAGCGGDGPTEATATASDPVTAPTETGSPISTDAPTTEPPAATETPDPTEPAETPGDGGRVIAEDFEFPVESSDEWQVEYEEQSTSSTRELQTEWALDPCQPTDYPTDAKRTDFAGVTRTSVEYAESHQLATYPDAATAREVVDGFLRVLDACTERTDEESGWTRFWNVEERGDGFVATANSESPEGVVPLGGEAVAVERRGNAVALVRVTSEFLLERGDVPPDIVDPLAAEVGRTLDALER